MRSHTGSGLVSLFSVMLYDSYRVSFTCGMFHTGLDGAGSRATRWWTHASGSGCEHPHTASVSVGTPTAGRQPWPAGSRQMRL